MFGDLPYTANFSAINQFASANRILISFTTPQNRGNYLIIQAKYVDRQLIIPKKGSKHNLSLSFNGPGE
jgi:hypothetical protein